MCAVYIHHKQQIDIKMKDKSNPPITKAWDWSKNTDNYWITPCIESAFLAERWNAEDFNNLLDLGCGLGRHTVYMGKHGFKVTAFDLSDEAVKSTRGWAERENLDIETYTGNMLSLPFQNNSFDCIIAYNVIYHTDMTGFGTILNEIQRILRPGGEMFLTLISKSTWSFTHANKAQKLDKNTILRNENEAGEDVPHFYVDIQDIKHFFTNFEFVRLPVEEHDYDIENPNKYSVHWKFIVKKKN